MEINYNKLVEDEFADICRVHDAKDKIGLQRAVTYARNNIVILESQGISSEKIPVVQQEIRDYYGKDFEVIPRSLIGHSQSFVGHNDPEAGFDNQAYQDARNRLGKSITQIMKRRVEELNRDPRMVAYRKRHDQN